MAVVVVIGIFVPYFINLIELVCTGCDLMNLVRYLSVAMAFVCPL